MQLKPLLLSTLFSAGLLAGASVAQQALTTPAQQSKSDSPDHHLVTIRVTDAKSLDKALSLDLDLAASHALELPARELEVIADDADLETLRKSGLDFRVEIRNYEDHIERQLAGFIRPSTLTPPVGQGGMGGHYTLAEIVAHIDKFHRDHPKLCSKKVSIGKSHEGREIWMVKISDNVNTDENEPEVLYDSLHHAREPLSVTAHLQFMDWLLDNYATDPVATRIVDTRELYFVPCLNPDGYEYNRRIRPGGGGMWRKNRRNNGGSFGVDLNRNWPTGWSAPFGGNSRNPTSDTYRGPSALSEPEALALDNFIKSRKFVLGCSSHTYTDILIRPWGYQRGDPTNVAEYRVIDAAATKSNGVRVGAASTLLYIAAGTAMDHYHSAHGMYAYTPELGRRDEGGFWPNPTNQVRISNRHQDMFKAFALAAGASVALADAKLSEGAGANNNGRIDPGENANLVATVKNEGAISSVTGVVVSLRSLTTGVTVTRASHSFGRVAKFSTANNSASPLTVAVSPSFRGATIKLELDLRYDGNSLKTILDVPVVTPFTIVETTFERDLGFRPAASTASTGRFERAAPQGTSSQSQAFQPGNDASPNGRLCWVTGASSGSSVGANDVDNGYTTFVTPLMDLSHVAAAKAQFQLWYAESGSNPDPFTIALSRDGGARGTRSSRGPRPGATGP